MVVSPEGLIRAGGIAPFVCCRISSPEVASFLIKKLSMLVEFPPPRAAQTSTQVIRNLSGLAPVKGHGSVRQLVGVTYVN